MSTLATRFFRTFDWVLLLVFLFNFFAIAGLFSIQTTARRTSDVSSLRYIAHGITTAAQEDPAVIQSAKDVRDVARILAEKKDLKSTHEWVSVFERDYPQNAGLSTVIEKGKLSPAFSRASLNYAVALQKLDDKTPPERPIAWTRGLKPTGTWATNNPYQGELGFIAFYSGATISYPNLNAGTGMLQRYDGKGTTANILEALPPGTRISEYVPTREDEATWFWSRLWQRYGGTGGSGSAGVPFLWAPLVLGLCIRLLRPRADFSRIARTLGLLVPLQVLLMWATY